MRKLRHIYIEMYGVNIYYIRCRREEYDRHIALQFNGIAPVKPKSDGTFEIYEKKGQDVGVIWLSAKADMSHLVHECFHAAYHFLTNRGLCLNDGSDEAYAYFLQYIFGKIKGILR